MQNIFFFSLVRHDVQFPADMSVTWNKKMRKTAGYCVTGQERAGGNRYARIELSEKVCDSAGNALVRHTCKDEAICLLKSPLNVNMQRQG